MTSFHRILDVDKNIKKSIFLFGPRQTGKTSLLKERFHGAPYFDLLQSGLFLQFSMHPESFRQECLHAIEKHRSPLIIDEIQKLPGLLDDVHSLIESHNALFILTGSSPRKLRRGGANLLGGRAKTRHLFPCVYPEIPDFDLSRAVLFGTLPSIYLSDDPRGDLLAYCGNYLQEEVQAEGLVRNLSYFSRFLEVAALSNAELVNFESLASDTGVTSKSIQAYFSILEDTLIGSMLRPYRKTIHRKAVATAKFYFFDVGVSNCLAGRWDIAPKTESFGKSFESLIYNEIRAYLDYTRDPRPLSFWRDRYGHEVDFIIGDDVVIEVKSTEFISEKHLKSLRMFCEEIACPHRVAVSLDARPRLIDTIRVLPWREFLRELWEGGFESNDCSRS
ncbi:MAG: ATP-binding protein [Chitinispirillaceae bacterium]|nr:ATP-binding protein [Chitinispirillaceae bacterium]